MLSNINNKTCLYKYTILGWNTSNYRRKTKTEEKAKVVAAVWGDRIDLIPCRDSYFALCRMIGRKGWIHPIFHIAMVQFILFFKSTWWKIASAARNCINSAPQAPPAFAFSSVFILLLCFQRYDYRPDAAVPGLQPVHHDPLHQPGVDPRVLGIPDRQHPHLALLQQVPRERFVVNLRPNQTKTL